MFPGQSSKYPGMIDRILEIWPAGIACVSQASEVLGRDLGALYRADNEQALLRNRDVQVGVFLANHLHMRAVEAGGLHADYSLGLSLGEFNHLVHIGALDFVDALRIVEARGALYDDGPRGMMVALFPIEIEMVESLVDRVRSIGTVEIANRNSPSQFVIAGEAGAVCEAARIADVELGVSATVIERRLPMHTSLFRPVAARLHELLGDVRWRSPVRAYVSNVTGGFVERPTAAELRDLLARHVHSPVRWRESIDAIVARVPNAVFVEVGPKAVLYNLLQRRWHSNRKFATDLEPRDTTHLPRLARTPSRSFESSASGEPHA